jgi:hypothetical protein
MNQDDGVSEPHLSFAYIGFCLVGFPLVEMFQADKPTGPVSYSEAVLPCFSTDPVDETCC